MKLEQDISSLAIRSAADMSTTLRKPYMTPAIYILRTGKVASAFFESILFIFLLGLLVWSHAAVAQITETFDTSTTWTAPAGVTSVTVEAWGGGGGGGAATGNPEKGGGGAGGQYARKVTSVTAGNNYAIIVGGGGPGGVGSNGGAGGDSTFAGTTVVAKGGSGGGWVGVNGGDGAAGAGSITGGIGDIVYRGGNGAAGDTDSNCNSSGAGGGGAGSGGNGGDASGNTGGTGTATGGGNGGNASNSSSNGGAGNARGGGGAGACAESNTDRSGGAGGAGRVVLTYLVGGVSGGCASSTVGSDTLVTCTANGAFTIPSGVSSVRYLVVGGGGGGGGLGTGDEQGAGGGGAGGVLSGTGFAVTPGSVYSVVVGGGGASGTGTSDGASGGNSTFSTLTAAGGGGGARETDRNGLAGGSGGGGSGSGTGGAGTGGQGNGGGNGDGAGTQGGAGGGGGAGAVGAIGSGTAGGNGGAGVSNDITGIATTYGGGGGGGGYGAAGGTGGAGGGGAAPAARGAGTAGTANTGGGGGGATGSGAGAAFSGGAGGSGIVMIRYATPLTCFTDDFNRADGAPAGNWVVANESGTFGNPAITSNRLRLTDATNSVSTMAALQQLFPAAGNKIVVEFDHFAYGGNGADGIGVVLSDASVAPVPGAFGGSLGYAQKQVSAGGDTTHPGFAGGWIGVAIDEYGNFSANTEGRSGGSAPGLTLDSVAIRGSGSAYTGYPYHRGTATLTPGIDLAGATPAPGYRYRITIDHTNGVNAFTSVERDTGSGYGFLIPAYDAKAEAGQAAVPTNWYLSFTGSTGGSTNIHEVDNLQVCSTNPQPVPTLDHLRLLHDTAALTCAAETVTVKACADAACDTLYLGSVTADLTNIAGATWSSDPVTFSGGQTSITLTKTTPGPVTLDAVAVPPVNATRCFNGATETCTLTYTTSTTCFDTVETGGNPSAPIYTKLAGTAFSLDVLATSGGVINTGYIGTIAVDLVDPTASSGNCGDTNLGLTPAVNYTFTSVNAGRRTYSFNYPYAASNVKVRIRDTAANQPACSADNFAIRPLQFALSTTSALNPATDTLVAGANFNLTADPGAAVTQGYTGTPVVDPTGIVDHNSAAIAAAAWAGNFTPIAAPGGGSLAGNFQYHDVGTIALNVDAVRDTTFTAVDQVTGIVGGVDHGVNGDCVAGSTTNTVASGKYGCSIGGAALGPLGRFKVDHFDLTAQFTAATCGAGTASEFTYMDHDALGLNLRLLAMSTNGTTLSRYTAGYASLGTLAIAGDNGGAAVALSRLSQPALAAVAWTSGGYSSAASLPETHRFDGRNALPAPITDGPYDSFRIKVEVNDPDGAKITALNGAAYSQTNATDPVYSPTTKIRFGRLRLLNAYGSELLPLRVQVRAEYFNGTTWTLNTADSCTSLLASAFALSGGIFANTSASAVALSSGIGTLTLAKPSPVAVGSVDVAANLGAGGSDQSCLGSHGGTGANMPWLRGFWAPVANCNSAAAWEQDPNARVRFGSPKAPYIYLRERY